MAAESIGVANLSEDVALGLAGDVEFRLHQVIEVRRLRLLIGSSSLPVSTATRQHGLR